MNNKTIYKQLWHQATSVIIVIAFAFTMIVPKVLAITEKPGMNTENEFFATPVPAEEVIELTMKDWVLQRVAEAGLNPAEAEAIIKCESVWNPDAMGVNTNRTVDLGLWQINSIHKDITNAEKLDYKKATEWAINKRLKDGHWRAWYCSRKLAYLK